MSLTRRELEFLDMLTAAVRSSIHRSVFPDLELRLGAIKLDNGVFPDRLPGETQPDYDRRMLRMQRGMPVIPSVDEIKDEVERPKRDIVDRLEEVIRAASPFSPLYGMPLMGEAATAIQDLRALLHAATLASGQPAPAPAAPTPPTSERAARIVSTLHYGDIANPSMTRARAFMRDLEGWGLRIVDVVP